MTPDRREELRRADDASFRTRLSLENQRLQARVDELDMQLSERILMDDLDISALKEAGLWNKYYGKPDSPYIVERIKALESLLCEAGETILLYVGYYVEDDTAAIELTDRIDAILPKTEEVK